MSAPSKQWVLYSSIQHMQTPLPTHSRRDVHSRTDLACVYRLSASAQPSFCRYRLPYIQALYARASSWVRESPRSAATRTSSALNLAACGVHEYMRKEESVKDGAIRKVSPLK